MYRGVSYLVNAVRLHGARAVFYLRLKQGMYNFPCANFHETEKLNSILCGSVVYQLGWCRVPHGTIRTVHTTYAGLSRPPPIQKLGAENHKLQLNIQCSWWWAYVPETCRAKNTSIKLPSCIKLAFHFISFGGICCVRLHLRFLPRFCPEDWGSTFLPPAVPNCTMSHLTRRKRHSEFHVPVLESHIFQP